MSERNNGDGLILRAILFGFVLGLCAEAIAATLLGALR